LHQSLSSSTIANILSSSSSPIFCR
jgi:hypothetical protein